jgi:fibronectin type 3 domain-containing protein
MDEQSGTTTYDATVNHNDGTLYGSTGFVTSGAFPPPPRNVAAQPGNGKVTLSWQPTITPTAIQYRVYRSTAGTARQLITTLNVGTNAYTDASPTNDTTYFYQVTTVDSSGSEG